MRGGAIVASRVLGALAGLLLLAAGVAVTGWCLGAWDASTVDVPSMVDATAARSALDDPWAPWVLGAVGLACGLAAIAWLAAVVPARPLSMLDLSASDRTGALKVDVSSVAQAAAEQLAHAGAYRPRGRTLVDRRQSVVDIDVTVTRDADIAALAQRAESVNAQTARVLGRSDVHFRVRLRPARRAGDSARVE